jgi:hypothetical protein
MYENIQKDIYSVLASSAFTSLGYKAYPSNYDGKIDTTKSFIRVSILPAKSELQTFRFGKVTNGILILSIFVKSGNGDKELFAIADKLDKLFQGKTLTNGTQFGPSMINKLGLDATDNTYYRGDYMINFTIHGE